jgi:hypothetical protein
LERDVNERINNTFFTLTTRDIRYYDDGLEPMLAAIHSALRGGEKPATEDSKVSKLDTADTLDISYRSRDGRES